MKKKNGTLTDKFMLLRAEYDEINYSSSDASLYLKQNNKISLYDYDSKILIEPNYDKITHIGSDYFELEKDNKKVEKKILMKQ